MSKFIVLLLCSFFAIQAQDSTKINKNLLLFEIASLPNYSRIGSGGDLSYQRNFNEKHGLRFTLSGSYDRTTSHDTSMYAYSDTVRRFSIDVGDNRSNSLGFSILYLRTLITKKTATLYVCGGPSIGYYLSTSTSRYTTRTVKYKSTEIGFQAGIGCQWRLADNLNLHVDLPVYAMSTLDGNTYYYSEDDYRYSNESGVAFTWGTCQIGLSFSF